MRTQNLPKLMLPLGLVLTVGWQVGQPLARLIWNASAAFSEMRAMAPKLGNLETKVEAQSQAMHRYEVTQGKILQALQDMNKRVVHTSLQVDSTHEIVARFAVPFQSVYESPITQN